MNVNEINNTLQKNNFIHKNKTAILFTAKIFIAAGLLIYITYSIDLNEIIKAVKNANHFIIAIVALFSILNIYLQFYKWKITSNSILKEDNNSKIWRSLFLGFSAGAFTPARIGEYFGRAIVFKDKSLIQVTVATLLDKIFVLLVVAFFGSISSVIFIHYYYNVTVYLTASLLIILFILFYFLFLLLFNDRFWDNLIFIRLKNSSKFQWLFDKLKVLRKLDKKYVTKMFSISTLFYICFLFQYALLVFAFSDHLGLLKYFWAGNLMMFAKTVIPPISLGELGIREGASVFFISWMGESASTGFNASIFLFFINVLIPSIIGLVLNLKKSND